MGRFPCKVIQWTASYLATVKEKLVSFLRYFTAQNSWENVLHAM